MIKRIFREIWIAFNIIFLETLRNPLSTIAMLIFYGFFYLIGYFLYGFATNEVTTFQKYLISGFIATSFLLQANAWWAFLFVELSYHGQLEEIILSYSYIELYLIGAFLYATIINFISISLALVAIYFLFGFPMFAIPIELFLIVIALSILSTFFAFIYNAISIMFKETWAVSNIVSYLLIVITPIFYPMEFLPTKMQYVSYLFPITWGVELLRSYMYGISRYDKGILWISFLTTSVVWSVISFFIWKKAYIIGKKTGQLYTSF